MMPFRFPYFLVGISFISSYLGLRLFASSIVDQRVLWIVAPVLSSTCFAVIAALGKQSYIRVLFAASFGAFAPLIIWSIEISLESEFASEFWQPTDLVTLLLWMLAAGGTVAVLGVLVGGLVRFAFDGHVSITVRRYCLSLAIIVFAGLTFLAFERWNDPAFRYRQLGDGNSLRPAIRRYIDNDDSLTYVRQTLGPGALGSHTKGQAWIDMQIQNKNRDGFDDEYPDGILPTDRFIAYSGFPGQFVIQFRDDHVVNLPKKQENEEDGREDD